jgi:assimilatory nitrate reductase catalytic subunit
MTQTTCPYCGVGCGVLVETAANTGEHSATFPVKVVAVRGDPQHPANFGRLCTKGSSLHLTADPRRQAVTRQLYPQARQTLQGSHTKVDWDDILNNLANRFAQCIVEHGPDSVAFYVSGQLLTEDYYVFNKLAKGLIGTNNIDSNSRLCMSSAVAGYKQSLGSDAPPLSYTDVELAQTLFITGSNAALAHPVLFRRIEAAREADPTKKLIVVDPRRTDTAAVADLHLAILPGTDVALYNSMLHIMIWERWIDQDFIDQHTEHFGRLSQRVREMTPKMGAQICGVAEKDLLQATQWFAQSSSTLSLYCQGLNQSSNGTANNSALINLHLACGQIARLGAGPFSLTGQPNAMGGREVGALSNLLPAHRQLENPDDRDTVAQFWQVKPLSPAPGKSAVDLFKAVQSKQIKMLWIACTNPVQSMPDSAAVAAALEQAELVVLQEAFSETATSGYAHVLLPAATWAEKDGTVTNSERRISRVRAALAPPAQAKPDWWIAAQFAQRLELALAARGQERRLNPNQSLFAFDDAESIWNEHRDSTRERDLDITGLSYSILEQGAQQWPFTDHSTTHLYLNKQFATRSGKAQFIDTPPKATADVVNSTYPILLTTARLRDQWHGMSRTGTVGHLFGQRASPSIDLNPLDATRMRFASGDFARITSRRGSIVLPVALDDSQRVGQAHIPMHWGSEYVGKNAINRLTNSAYCPTSMQPELKFSAVRLETVALPYRVVMLVWCSTKQANQIRRELVARFGTRAFCYAGLFNRGALAAQLDRDVEGVFFKVADLAPIELDELIATETSLGIAQANLLRYQDPVHATARRMAITAGQMTYLAIQGDLRAEAWLAPMLKEGVDVSSFRANLLLPINPQFSPAEADIVICQCLGVKRSQINKALSGSARSTKAAVDHLKNTLGCATECGSCATQLQNIVQQKWAVDHA